MNPANSPVPSAPRRRRIWPWVLGLCLAPWALIAVVVASYVTLDRDVAVLRREVMHATGADWHTKVQCSVGRVTIGAVRAGLVFVPKPEIDDARLALAAVKHVSVGVYERGEGKLVLSREQLFSDTDRVMQQRGWTRLVGVAEHHDEAVLVYVPEDFDDDEPVDICLAVVNDRELVVCSTTLDADSLSELVAKHTPEQIRKIASRHRAKL